MFTPIPSNLDHLTFRSPKSGKEELKSENEDLDIIIQTRLSIQTNVVTFPPYYHRC